MKVHAKFEVRSFTRSCDNNTVYRYFKFAFVRCNKLTYLLIIRRTPLVCKPPSDAGISREDAGPNRIYN